MEPGLEAGAVKSFFRVLEGASSSLLMLDYDGTLAPFRVDPAQARPYPGVCEELEGLVRAGGTRVILVTGRPLDSLLPLIPLPDLFEIWASHGRERRRAGGEVVCTPPTERQREGLAEARRRFEGSAEAGRLEGKPFSLALHVRGAEPAAAARALEAARGLWAPLCREWALELLPFEGGLEIRASGGTKAEAVQTSLAESPPGAASAYLGDDETDEDAFRALGERGLPVLVRPEWRKTRARAWLRPPGELLSFLRRWRRLRAGGAG